MTPIQKKLAELREKSKGANRHPWKLKQDSIYDHDKNLVCTLSDIWPRNDNRDLIVTACNSYSILLEVIEGLSEALNTIQDVDAAKNPGPSHVSIWSIAEQSVTKAQELLEKIEK